MFKSGTKLTYQITALLIICAASAFVGFASRKNNTPIAAVSKSAMLQWSDEKVIDRKQFLNEPFKVADLKVKSTDIDLNEKFSAQSLAQKAGGNFEDWIDNLSFTIQNTSDKKLTYMAFSLDFPETAAIGGSMMVYTMEIGRHPQDVENKKGERISLDAGDYYTVTISTNDLKKIKSFLLLKGYQLVNLNKVTIWIDYVIYDNELRWEQGYWYQPDPSNPKKYNRLAAN